MDIKKKDIPVYWNNYFYLTALSVSNGSHLWY